MCPEQPGWSCRRRCFSGGSCQPRWRRRRCTRRCYPGGHSPPQRARAGRSTPSNSSGRCGSRGWRWQRLGSGWPGTRPQLTRSMRPPTRDRCSPNRSLRFPCLRTHVRLHAPDLFLLGRYLDGGMRVHLKTVSMHCSHERPMMWDCASKGDGVSEGFPFQAIHQMQLHPCRSGA